MSGLLKGNWNQPEALYQWTPIPAFSKYARLSRLRHSHDAQNDFDPNPDDPHRITLRAGFGSRLLRIGADAKYSQLPLL